MRGSATVGLLAIVVVIAAALYPALAMNRVVAPEASLKGVEPWRLQWGPHPSPSPLAFHAATQLGPRLHVIAREGVGAALWNPWIGGGRAGWLASPREGGAPLPLLAAWLARPGREWTALVSLQILAAFATCWWVLRRLGMGGWPAAVGATAYALSGALASTWLDWRGSALALGPLALLPALMTTRSWRRRAAGWGAVLGLLVFCGPPALAFVALGLARELAGPALGATGRASARWAAVAVGCGLAMAVLTPRLWLAEAGREPGAPARAKAPGAPVIGVRALLQPFPAGDPNEGGWRVARGADLISGGGAFVGASTILLAFLGAVRGRLRDSTFWITAGAAAFALCAAPSSWLTAVGVTERPFGVLALCFAVLAAGGAAAIATVVTGAWRPFAAAFVLAVLLLRLLPSAVHRLPFAYPEDAELPSPLPAQLVADDGRRAIALLAALPPDIGATLGIADVRAADLSEEPIYAATLGVRGGEIAVERALDATTAALGAGWVLEPLPLRVVSGELFARIEQTELRSSGASHVIDVPPGVCRLGLRAQELTTQRPRLRGAVGTAVLTADDSLADESDDWRWFALPDGWPSGPARLELGVTLDEMGIAWDRSGLRRVAEVNGLRIWRWDHAPPIAFALPDGPGHAVIEASDTKSWRGVTVVERAAGRLVLRTEADTGVLVALQIKHRPRLWRAEVDGSPVAIEAVGPVWSGVRVGPGVHDVRVAARLPLGVWMIGGLGLAGIATLAFGRRE